MKRFIVFCLIIICISFAGLQFFPSASTDNSEYIEFEFYGEVFTDADGNYTGHSGMWLPIVKN